MRTGSAQSPSYAHATGPLASRTTPSPRARPGVDRLGRRLGAEANQVSTNGTRSPADTADLTRLLSCPRRAARPSCRAGARSGRRSRAARRRSGAPTARRAVVEADRQVGRDLDLTAHALDDPDEDRVLLPRRHEVDDANRALGQLEGRLQHERVGPVPACYPLRLVSRREQPATVLGVPEQGREAGAGVEAGEAEPVDRPCRATRARRSGDRRSAP